jgi:hypothetical protein
MNNLNPNKTDIFFKQALESVPDLSPNEKDWKQMEHLLKDQPKSGPVLPWLYWSAGVAAALLIFFSFWFYTNSILEPSPQVQNKTPQNVNDPKLKEQNPKQVQGNIPGDKVELAISEQSPILPASKNKVKSSKKITTIPFDSEQNTLLYSLSIKPIIHADEQITQVIKPEFIQDSVASINAGILKEINTQEANVQNTEASLIAEAGKVIQKPDSIPSKTKSEISYPTKKWGLSMAFASDFNSVNGITNSLYGYSLGMGVNYKISKTISASTGLYYSQKQYSSDKASYKTEVKPFSTWASYSRKIQADCEVIDIPLNLNLLVKSGPEINLLASAGLSSYFMISERYNFLYNPTPNYPSSGRTYRINNSNRHVLSVINLAFGLEKPLTKQSSIIIQPYAKIPLSGIGQGETDLRSYGLGLQLNYSMKKKTKFFGSGRDK